LPRMPASWAKGPLGVAHLRAGAPGHARPSPRWQLHMPMMR
jgi:hypothetical protein